MGREPKESWRVIENNASLSPEGRKDGMEVSPAAVRF